MYDAYVLLNRLLCIKRALYKFGMMIIINRSGLLLAGEYLLIDKSARPVTGQ